MTGARGHTSWVRSKWVLLAMLLLGDEPSRATTCWVPPSVLWPAGIRDVPRQVRPILLHARPIFPNAPSIFRIRLLDAGPIRPGDVLAPADVPEGAREVRSRLQPFSELGDPAGAVEVIPEEGPLPPNHRFVITIGEQASASFATGERLELAAGPTEALRFVVYDVIAPSIYVNGSFELPRHDAEVILLLPGPDRSARRLVVSLATDDQSSGRFLVEARDRKMVIGGQHGCVPPGPAMEGPGRAELLIREWTPAGLTVPVRVEVEIPKPKRRRD